MVMSINNDLERLAADRLLTFTAQVFQHCGLSSTDAAQAADVLVSADLRGIDSHGVARLSAYVTNLEKGSTNPRPKLRIVRETPTTATVDADNGLGLVVATQANAIAIEKALKYGSGWVAVRNSSHFGIAGYYSMKAAACDLIGWTMTNTSKVVAPLGGVERMLGTNPIAVAIPALTQRAVLIDMSTSVVSWGKIEIARRAGEPIPRGWAVDANGIVTTDPNVVIDKGSLSPLGGTRELGAHKGYCLAALVDLISGVLSGANWGPFVPPFVISQQDASAKRVGAGIGHMFGAMRIDGFADVHQFKKSVDQWVHVMRASKPIPGGPPPEVPGDPEWKAEDDRRCNGIPLNPVVWAELKELGRRFDITI